MSEPASVDVIVPVHGGWPLVSSCLEHLARQTLPVQVIVVDDRSPDDTADRVERAFPDVRLVRQESNRGFGSACNAGIAAGDSEVVVILNSDVDAGPALVGALAEAILSDASVGSAAPLLLRPDGSVDSFGITADPTLAGFVRWVGVRPEQADGDSPVLLGPYGAAAAYRRAALEQVGGFDEAIFMYGEELDLALRLRSAGWECKGVPAANGVHVGGGTVGRAGARQRFLGGFGRGYLLRAYRVLRSRWGLRALAAEGIASFAALVRHRDFAGIRGRVAGWRAARGAAPRARPVAGIDGSLGFVASLRMRGSGYWSRRAG